LRLRLLGTGLCFALLACSPARYSNQPGGPTLVLPGRFAEGSPEPAASSSVATPPSASAPASPPSPAVAASKLPDPTPLQMAEQVEYDLELAAGKIRAVSIKPVTLPSAVVTPRRLGRWAIELSIGNELIERVRFDFPGTAADEPVPGRKKLNAPLDLSSRAVARIKLLVPHSPRVRRALLVDRAMNSVTELEWPLPPVPAPAAPAETPSAQ
jgi:hypothetical protein